MPFFRLAVGGLGPSQTEKTSWPNGAPATVNLSLPFTASVVPFAGTISKDHLFTHLDVLKCPEKSVNVGLHRLSPSGSLSLNDSSNASVICFLLASCRNCMTIRFGSSTLMIAPASVDLLGR